MSIAVFEAVPDDVPHDVPDQVFRRRDVRGRYGDTLTLAGARLIGRAFSAQARAEGTQRVLLGRDGRLSSPDFESALVDGLTKAGTDVSRIGLGAAKRRASRQHVVKRLAQANDEWG